MTEVIYQKHQIETTLQHGEVKYVELVGREILPSGLIDDIHSSGIGWAPSLNPDEKFKIVCVPGHNNRYFAIPKS